MARGTSLHIGLNGVDPDAYDGWDGELAGCENDANDMAAIASQRGFEDPQVVLTRDATSETVLSRIADAAGRVGSGDIFLLTYSGHGGQVPDGNSDEDDRRDETWVAWDRQIVDDELYELFSQFPEGARIVLLSDSCHSGSVARAMPDFLRAEALPEPSAQKALPEEIAERNYEQNSDTYDAIQKQKKAYDQVEIPATLLLISGCQDNQTSLDGARNGLFTENLRAVWADGQFAQGYRLFHKRIVSQMPPNQTPNFMRVGRDNPAFVEQQPFTV